MSQDTKMTKCQYYNCREQAKGVYPACSESHGVALRKELRDLPDLFDADDCRRHDIREIYPVERAIYYFELGLVK